MVDDAAWAACAPSKALFQQWDEAELVKALSKVGRKAGGPAEAIASAKVKIAEYTDFAQRQGVFAGKVKDFADRCEKVVRPMDRGA